MVVRKKSGQKTIKKTQEEIIIKEVKSVPLSSLKMFHRNPRIGNVDEIAKSLHLNRQFKPIVVNIGTYTGRPNEILGGNHTYLGARKDLTWTEEDGTEYHKVGWENIYAAFVDVDETHATKIALADNRTAEYGTYDETILANLFKNLPDVSGTGYTSAEVDDILAGLELDVDAALVQDENSVTTEELLKGMTVTEREEVDNRNNRQKYAEERTDDQKAAAAARGASVDADDDEDADSLEDVSDVAAEVQVLLELKEENVWKGDNDWGIPELRSDMILERFPDKVQTWGGAEATPDDGKSWYLYNYSLGGLKGLPFDRTILCFYTYDTKFMNWWDYPAYYTSRIMAKGVKVAVVPDFSFYYTETRTHHLWGVYRAQWLGKFFQEAGMKVIPRLQFDFRDPKSLEVGLLSIPHETPTLACSIQNTNEAADKPVTSKMLREALEQIQPKQFLVYGGNPGWKIAQESGWKGEMFHAMNYSGVRRELVFGVKQGAAKLTEKQKKEIRKKATGSPDKVASHRIEPNDDEL